MRSVVVRSKDQRATAGCIGLLLMTVTGLAQTFDGNRLAVNDSKEIPVELSLGQTNLIIKQEAPRWGKPDPAALRYLIEYGNLVGLSYGFTHHVRAAEALTGGLLALAVTSPLHHWLVIESNTAGVPNVVVLRLSPAKYRDVISALNDKSGKRVALLDPKSQELDPSAGSTDIDEVVPFRSDQILLAIKPAMESMACTVSKTGASDVVCHRRHVNSDRTGIGGETISAGFTPDGNTTRVKITTLKPALHGGRNWSTPVYREMLKRLEPRPEVK
jgi:hypothetical protein